jgi:hypothetical protein
MLAGTNGTYHPLAEDKMAAGKDWFSSFVKQS